MLPKRLIGLGAVTLTLSFMACLTAPNEPAGGPRSCVAGQAFYNGACRFSCHTTSDCTGGLTCMVVGAGASVCLDYAHCAYLGSDTSCDQSAAGGSYYGYGGYDTGPLSYDPYWVASPYSVDTPYSYQGQSCAGNASWVVFTEGGDPACGGSHVVNRCRATPKGCELLTGTTEDIAEP